MPRPLDYLITNDDGIHAPGLLALRNAYRNRARFLVAAPSSQRSAVGHAITIHRPIICDEVPLAGGGTGWSIDGTPADCVKLALGELATSRPRFVLSGINFGDNLGINVYYSGTVAAALEGAFCGLPSFALSLATKSDPLFTEAAKTARWIVRKFAPLIDGTPICLNVNIPNVPFRKIRGVRIARQAHTPYEDLFHRRRDPRGRVYFWMDGSKAPAKPGRARGHEMTDVDSVRAGYVSITPLRLTMTCEATFESLAGSIAMRPGRTDARRPVR